MSDIKRYFFRDLDHKSNLKDGKSYHAAGVVTDDTGYTCASGKDLVTAHLNPFTGVVEREWRGRGEVAIYEVTVREWEAAIKLYGRLEEDAKRLENWQE